MATNEELLAGTTEALAKTLVSVTKECGDGGRCSDCPLSECSVFIAP